MAGFAKYDGIDGESRDADHENWIDVLSLDWGAQRPSGGAIGSGRRRGAAVVDDLVLTIEYEKAAPKLLEGCLRGRVVPTLEIEFTATVGGDRSTYLRYELKNVMVTSYQVSASGNDEAGPPTVTVANNFEEIKVTYSEFDSEGGLVGNVETEYSVERGTARAGSAGTAVSGIKTKKKKKKKSKKQ